jgi:hypothetical protein
VFHTQLERRTQLIEESLQELAATIDCLTHCAHVELPEHLISKGAACVFGDGIRK